MTEETESGQSYEDRARAQGPPPPPKAKAGELLPPEGPDPDAWMVTFSDLLTLLMTFFVLIFASQDPVKEKFFEAFGQSTGVFGLFRTSFFEKISVVPKQDISQDRVQIFLDEIGAADIEVVQELRGLVITLPTQAFFKPGTAVLTPEARKRIEQLSKYLQFTKHDIRVEGHTDNREARRGSYGDDWRLSVARSHVVLKELIRREISPKRLSVVGYGGSRPRFDNISRLGRLRNRRVELVILNRGEIP